MKKLIKITSLLKTAFLCHIKPQAYWLKVFLLVGVLCLGIVGQVKADACNGVTSVNYEGENYPIVAINDQCWFGKNLNVGTIINAPNDPTNNSIIEKWCYNNQPENCEAYFGGLYSWNEIMRYTNIEGSQGICPNDWHIPTDADWKILVESQGTIDCETSTGFQCDPAGTKLKATSSPYFNASTLSGLVSASGGFSQQDTIGFWSSTLYSSMPEPIAFSRIFSETSTQIDRRKLLTYVGLSVRCIKNSIVTPKCATLPTGASWCSGDGTNADTAGELHGVTTCSNQKCEFTCASGVIGVDGKSCGVAADTDTWFNDPNNCETFEGSCGNTNQCGTLPTGAVGWCSGDGTTANTAGELHGVTTCSTQKCEFTCASGLIGADGKSCGVAATPTCKAKPVSNTEWCPGDGTTADSIDELHATTLNECSSNVKCQYYNICAPKPTNATWCPVGSNDDSMLVQESDAGKKYEVSSLAQCTAGRSCEYYIPTCKAKPTGTLWCPNDDTGLSAGENNTYFDVTDENGCVNANNRKCEYYTPKCFAGDLGSALGTKKYFNSMGSGTTLCSGDATGLSTDTPNTLVSSCGTNKCEHTCNSGLALNKYVSPYACSPVCDGICNSGDTFANATQNMTKACANFGDRCYQCKTDYKYDTTTKNCVYAYSCDAKPTDAVWCYNDDKNVPKPSSGFTMKPILKTSFKECSTATKCEYFFPVEMKEDGYEFHDYKGEDKGFLYTDNVSINEKTPPTGTAPITIEGAIWSKNFGWIDLAPGMPGGVTATYKADNASSKKYALSGYGWNKNIGWLDFSQATIGTNGIWGGTAWNALLGYFNFYGTIPEDGFIEEIRRIDEKWIENNIVCNSPSSCLNSTILSPVSSNSGYLTKGLKLFFTNPNDVVVSNNEPTNIKIEAITTGCPLPGNKIVDSSKAFMSLLWSSNDINGKNGLLALSDCTYELTQTVKNTDGMNVPSSIKFKFAPICGNDKNWITNGGIKENIGNCCNNNEIVNSSGVCIVSSVPDCNPLKARNSPKPPTDLSIIFPVERITGQTGDLICPVGSEKCAGQDYCRKDIKDCFCKSNSDKDCVCEFDYNANNVNYTDDPDVTSGRCGQTRCPNGNCPTMNGPNGCFEPDPIVIDITTPTASQCKPPATAIPPGLTELSYTYFSPNNPYDGSGITASQNSVCKACPAEKPYMIPGKNNGDVYRCVPSCGKDKANNDITRWKKNEDPLYDHDYECKYPIVDPQPSYSSTCNQVFFNNHNLNELSSTGNSYVFYSEPGGNNKNFSVYTKLDNQTFTAICEESNTLCRCLTPAERVVSEASLSLASKNSYTCVENPNGTTTTTYTLTTGEIAPFRLTTRADQITNCNVYTYIDNLDPVFEPIVTNHITSAENDNDDTSSDLNDPNIEIPNTASKDPGCISKNFTISGQTITRYYCDKGDQLIIKVKDPVVTRQTSNISTLSCNIKYKTQDKKYSRGLNAEASDPLKTIITFVPSLDPKINIPEDKGVIECTASDFAGNTTTVTYHYIYDNTPPRIILPISTLTNASSTVTTGIARQEPIKMADYNQDPVAVVQTDEFQKSVLTNRYDFVVKIDDKKVKGDGNYEDPSAETSGIANGSGKLMFSKQSDQDLSTPKITDQTWISAWGIPDGRTDKTGQPAFMPVGAPPKTYNDYRNSALYNPDGTTTSIPLEADPQPTFYVYTPFQGFQSIRMVVKDQAGNRSSAVFFINVNTRPIVRYSNADWINIAKYNNTDPSDKNKLNILPGELDDSAINNDYYAKFIKEGNYAKSTYTGAVFNPSYEFNIRDDEDKLISGANGEFQPLSTFDITNYLQHNNLLKNDTGSDDGKYFLSLTYSDNIIEYHPITQNNPELMTAVYDLFIDNTNRNKLTVTYEVPNNNSIAFANQSGTDDCNEEGIKARNEIIKNKAHTNAGTPRVFFRCRPGVRLTGINAQKGKTDTYVIDMRKLEYDNDSRNVIIGQDEGGDEKRPRPVIFSGRENYAILADGTIKPIDLEGESNATNFADKYSMLVAKRTELEYIDTFANDILVPVINNGGLINPILLNQNNSDPKSSNIPKKGVLETYSNATLNIKTKTIAEAKPIMTVGTSNFETKLETYSARSAEKIDLMGGYGESDSKLRLGGYFIATEYNDDKKLTISGNSSAATATNVVIIAKESGNGSTESVDGTITNIKNETGTIGNGGQEAAETFTGTVTDNNEQRDTPIAPTLFETKVDEKPIDFGNNNECNSGTSGQFKCESLDNGKSKQFVCKAQTTKKGITYNWKGGTRFNNNNCALNSTNIQSTINSFIKGTPPSWQNPEYLSKYGTSTSGTSTGGANN